MLGGGLVNQIKRSKKTEAAEKVVKKASPGRGGARLGAGRKSGSGAFGEGTVPMRVPMSMAVEIEQALEDLKEHVANGQIAARSMSALGGKSQRLAELGAPAPQGKAVDLSKMLASHPETCCAWRAVDDLLEWGVKQGDVVVIDRSQTPHEGSLGAFWFEGGVELMVVERSAQGVQARRCGVKKPACEAASFAELPVWGVAVGLARKLL